MKKAKSTGIGDTPLKFAAQLSEVANSEWKRSFERFSPITQDLLKFWFSDTFCDNRKINFHAGQKQAILNTIYCHEILGVQSVLDMYRKASDGLLDEKLREIIDSEKHSHPKYCIKMATGTGKTWCMNALFLWQYLNAKFEMGSKEIPYTKNFLFVAPGLIVYERLLDSFLGKENSDGTRDFESSDLKRNKDLFIPYKYREAVYNFVQTSTMKKEEIGKKTTGEGIIAITNWHALNNEDELQDCAESHSPKALIKGVLPIQPGKTAGHTLDSLDSRYFRGEILEYLRNLPDICVFNDEAHHIHEDKTGGMVTEVEWQKALNSISAGKNTNFLQVDFSATPYNVLGTGQNRIKSYFPHIIADFSLNEAIKTGLVKMIAIDRRKELSSLEDGELGFSAVRDSNKAISLSKGQRFMLRAGLQKLRLLEEEFTRLDAKKHPKMLVICEDTNVSPLVTDFLQEEGLGEDEVFRIDSDRKGELGEKEWKKAKQKLFHIDNRVSPKVIVSVLMLREGFDVNNICVIVPLRASEAPILLEQVIGRGLRLMWREEQYKEIKAETRARMLKKQDPCSQFDILHIIEHPAYIRFYEDLNDEIVFEEKEELSSGKILGDLINVGLKENYRDYDFYIPIIEKAQEEYLSDSSIGALKFEKFAWSIGQLQAMAGGGSDEVMIAEDVLVKTRFGEYKVRGDLFDAQSYNEYIVKIINAISLNVRPSNSRQRRYFPTMQINHAELAGILDNYIRKGLFGTNFDPLDGSNWKILMTGKVPIVEHILRQISMAIDNMQRNVDIDEAEVTKHNFSEASSISVRENYSLNIEKSIYKRTPYPSNKGKYEKDFMLYADADAAVERLMKIDIRYHDFAGLRYIRTDGHFATYFPDFLIKIANDIYVVETKAHKDLKQEEVLQKQRGATYWTKRINELPSSYRMESEWHYVILGDKDFYSLRQQNASMRDMMANREISAARAEGMLI